MDKSNKRKSGRVTKETSISRSRRSRPRYSTSGKEMDLQLQLSNFDRMPVTQKEVLSWAVLLSVLALLLFGQKEKVEANHIQPYLSEEMSEREEEIENLVVLTPDEHNLLNDHNTKIERPKITNPPFHIWMQVAEVLPEKYGNDLKQNISDMRIEYFDALKKQNIWRVRFIVVDYYTGLAWSAVKWIAERAKELIGFMPKVN